MIIKCDEKVYNPLGGGSYVFEKDIIRFIINKYKKDRIIISIGAQPNSSPHFGTLVVFSTAFSVAKEIKRIFPEKNVSILFEVVDTAPSETIEINGVKYQKSLKESGKMNEYLTEYLEILNYYKNKDDIDFNLRYQNEFNNQKFIPSIVSMIIKKKRCLASILDPKYNKLRIRVACPQCGLSDKNSINTIFKANKIISVCPIHGEFITSIKKEAYKLEYNTPLRNLIRAICYYKHNYDKHEDSQFIRVTGGDYAGFYQEKLLYKPVSLLKIGVEKLPVIIYAPLILDWSGAKISKSLYVKEGAYNDLPNYLINYRNMITYWGIKGLDIIHSITDDWIENPYKLFRNYSIYYFEKEFKNYEESIIYKH